MKSNLNLVSSFITSMVWHWNCPADVNSVYSSKHTQSWWEAWGPPAKIAPIHETAVSLQYFAQVTPGTTTPCSIDPPACDLHPGECKCKHPRRYPNIGWAALEGEILASNQEGENYMFELSLSLFMSHLWLFHHSNFKRENDCNDMSIFQFSIRRSTCSYIVVDSPSNRVDWCISDSPSVNNLLTARASLIPLYSKLQTNQYDIQLMVIWSDLAAVTESAWMRPLFGRSYGQSWFTTKYFHIPHDEIKIEQRNWNCNHRKSKVRMWWWIHVMYFNLNGVKSIIIILMMRQWNGQAAVNCLI